MRKVLLVAFLGLGFYLGWFGLTTSRNPETGAVGVELKVDSTRMKADAERARQKVGGGAAQAGETPHGK
jgi:hypothetical protein